MAGGLVRGVPGGPGGGRGRQGAARVHALLPRRLRRRVAARARHLPALPRTARRSHRRHLGLWCRSLVCILRIELILTILI